MFRLQTLLVFIVLFFGSVSLAQADTITLVDSGTVLAEQSGVYVTDRDIRRRGGHGWRWKSPNPFGDGRNQGNTTLQFPINNLAPAGSSLISAVFTWKFSNLAAVTTQRRPDEDNWASPNSARAPRAHGTDRLCSGQPCSPAAIDHFAPEAAFWANHLILEGIGIYWFPQAMHRNPSGSMNLLDLWSAEELLTHNLIFVGTVQYDMGRPFFRTEGWNSRTEFDVWGHSRVDMTGSLDMNFTSSAPPSSEVPEPTALLMLGTGLAGISAVVRKRRNTGRHSQTKN